MLGVAFVASAMLVWQVAANSLVNEAYFDDLEGLPHHNLHGPFFAGACFFLPCHGLGVSLMAARQWATRFTSGGLAGTRLRRPTGCG
jgi:hypothetical protein